MKKIISHSFVAIVLKFAYWIPGRRGNVTFKVGSCCIPHQLFCWWGSIVMVIVMRMNFGYTTQILWAIVWPEVVNKGSEWRELFQIIWIIFPVTTWCFNFHCNSWVWDYLACREATSARHCLVQCGRWETYSGKQITQQSAGRMQ